MNANDFVSAHPSYSLDNAIRNGIAAEEAYAQLDLGPVDTLDPKIRQAEYDLFFGASPLSSPSPSPSPSRSSSPNCTKRNVDLQHDDSPLSSLLPSQSVSPKHNLHPPADVHCEDEEPCPDLSPPADAYHDRDGEDHLSKKARRKRVKSHGNRRRKRQEAHAQQDPNAVRYPNSHKHFARAETTTTSYDTNDIPSASSGFVALSDLGDSSSKVHEARELLEGEVFKLIRWKGM